MTHLTPTHLCHNHEIHTRVRFSVRRGFTTSPSVPSVSRAVKKWFSQSVMLSPDFFYSFSTHLYINHKFQYKTDYFLQPRLVFPTATIIQLCVIFSIPIPALSFSLPASIILKHSFQQWREEGTRPAAKWGWGRVCLWGGNSWTHLSPHSRPLSIWTPPSLSEQSIQHRLPHVDTGVERERGWGGAALHESLKQCMVKKWEGCSIYLTSSSH